MELEIVHYSEKAIALFGDTKPYKEQLKELGGRFNFRLKRNGNSEPGWIFPIKKEDELKEFLTTLPDIDSLPTKKESSGMVTLRPLTKEEFNIICILIGSSQNRDLIDEFVDDGDLPKSYLETFDNMQEDSKTFPELNYDTL